MGLKRDEKKVKSVEEWTAADWEVAYNVLQTKYDKLRNVMRRALQVLSVSI
ncbi:MAG TPA: hypothetical protein VMW10_08025 [Alphaproteobacteria bacterium]|nr:hypothetical protein [Alphaproteobacteria bacterium]